MLDVKIRKIIYFVDAKKAYRVISIYQKIVTLCELNSTRLNLINRSYDSLNDDYERGEIRIIPEEDHVFDINEFTEAQRKRFELKQALMRETANLFGPSYIDLVGRKSKPVLKKLLEKYNVRKETFWRTLRVYLQSGMSDFALIDAHHFRGKFDNGYNYNKKPGRTSDIPQGKLLDEEDIKHFKEAIAYIRSGRAATISKVYDWFISNYYSEEVMGQYVLKPICERPTYNQFYYYVHKNVTAKELDKIRTSEMEQRNNKRFLASDNLSGVRGPMDLCEIDACEVDISVVYGPDKYNKGEYKCVGRPVLYAMIDVFSRVVVAIGVSFDNNSYVGFTNLFLNLAEDKVKFAASYGIQIESSRFWPSGCLPNRIRVDRGAEFKGKEVARVCRELNIQRELAPAGTGSLKGQVEQFFHQMHSDLRIHLENHGEITKRYDSNHHEESTLTIEEFMKLVINCVVIHNQRELENYPYTGDMIEKGVRCIPVLLWEYGMQKYCQPIPISSVNQFLYTLCLPRKATLSNNKGICYNGLHYLPHGDSTFYDRCFKLGRKKEKIEIRIDPRSVNEIYYKLGNTLIKASLNMRIKDNEDYLGMTWTEYEIYKKKKLALRRAGQRYNDEVNATAFQIYKGVVESAVKEKEAAGVIESDTKNMRENRDKAKQEKQYENRISERLDVNDKRTFLIPDNKPDSGIAENSARRHIEHKVTVEQPVQLPVIKKSDKDEVIEAESMEELLNLF